MANAAATVRVYLFSYRRKTVERALASLLRQSFGDWICELHNDDPNDKFPSELVAKIKDPRIIYLQHSRNIGAVASFNHAWRPIPERYMAILEDDNWWEPEFLATLVREMDERQNISMCWANMRYWRESTDNNWTAENTIWPYDSSEEIRIFDRLLPQQLMQNIHSQGAMLVRTTEYNMRPAPDNVPLFMIEAARERNIAGPFMLIVKPLANFALTSETARKENLVQKLGGLALLVEGCVKHTTFPISFYQDAWKYYWWAGRMSLRAIVLGSIFGRRLDIILRSGRPMEVILAFVWFLRHPMITTASIIYILKQTELRSYVATMPFDRC